MAFALSVRMPTEGKRQQEKPWYNYENKICWTLEFQDYTKTAGI